MTDFIKLPAWPAFNVSDMAITFGVLSLLYVLEGGPSKRASEATPSERAPALRLPVPEEAAGHTARPLPV